MWGTQGKSNPQSQGKLRWQWKELHLLEQCAFPRCTDFFHKDATCVYKDTCRLESSLLPTSIFPAQIGTKAKGIIKVAPRGAMQVSCGLTKHSTIPVSQAVSTSVIVARLFTKLTNNSIFDWILGQIHGMEVMPDVVSVFKAYG